MKQDRVRETSGNILLKMIFIAMLCLLAAPWFEIDSSVTDPLRGHAFFSYLMVPYGYLCYFIWSGQRLQQKILYVVAELALSLVIAIHGIIFTRLISIFMIGRYIDLTFSFSVAKPCFWLSLALAVITVIILPIQGYHSVQRPEIR